MVLVTRAGALSRPPRGDTDVVEDATQILAGYGCVREHPVERRHRDSTTCTDFQGASEAQPVIIARAISGEHVR